MFKETVILWNKGGSNSNVPGAASPILVILLFS